MSGVSNVDNDCNNKNLLLYDDELLADEPIGNIIKLWDGSCFEISELAQTMIGSNGANRHPYAAPGTNTLLWRNKEELESIINFPTLDPQHKNTLTEILAN